MAKQQFNRRLSGEAIAAINWWAKQDSTPARKVTDTEIVERAIAYYDEMRASGGEIQIPTLPQGRSERGTWEVAPSVPRPSQGRITNIVVPSLSELVESGAITQGLPPKVGFPCRCVHSGCQGSKFQGTSKFANLCPECEEKGHLGNQRECQECFNDTGPA